jgi:Carboxypeptidase regulatory-like domain
MSPRNISATAVVTSAVSNAEGLFSFPGLSVGAYTVTVSLQGFKTFLATNVVLTSGAGANVRAVLEVGGLEEQVTVISQSEILQTQTSHISTTINSNQIVKLPLTTRAALDFVAMMPGGPRQAGIAIRPSTACRAAPSTLRSTV